MDPVSILFALGQFVPSLLRFAGKETAAQVADKALAAGRALTGQSEVDGVIQALKADPMLLARFQGMANDLAIAEMQEETKRLAEINATMRAEIGSTDPYVRRARPTFLYAMALTWALQAIGLLAAVLGWPERAADIIKAGADLTTMWGIALAVVGVYFKSRSDDKKIASGHEAPSMLEAVGRLLKR